MTRTPDALTVAATALFATGGTALAVVPLAWSTPALAAAAALGAGGALLVAAALRNATSARRCHRLLDGQRDAVLAVAPSGHIVNANTAARALFRHDRLTGLPLADLLPSAAEETSPSDLGTERNGVREITGLTADGHSLFLEISTAPPVAGCGTVVLSLRDGSARRGADDTLRRQTREMERNTRLLREIEHLAHIGCYDFYPATDEAQWSRELERIFGLEPVDGDTTRGLETFLSHVHPDDLPDVLADAQDQSWKERERVFRIIRTDGSIRHLFSKGYREFGADGRVTRLFGIEQDITDYLMTEAAMRDSEDTLRRIFDAAPVPMTVVSEDGRPLAANRRALALFGVVDEDLPRLRVEDFYVDLADRDRLMRMLHENGRVPGMDVELRTRDGRRIWVDLSAALVSYQGTPAVLAGFVDIDARKRTADGLAAARDSLRRLLEAVPLPMMLGRLSDGRILYINEEAAALLDVTPDQAVGQGAVGFFHTREDFEKAINTLRRHRRLDSHEVRFRDAPDGTERWMVISGIALEFEGEDAAMCTATNITDRHHAQDLLSAAKTQAEWAAQAKSDFLALMGHEIRMPMNGILGMVQVLSATRLSPIQRGYVETIQRSGDSLLRLVDAVMDLSRIEAGSLSVAVTPFDPRAPLEEAAGLMRPSAMAQGLTLDVEVHDGLPDRVSGDPARITQVLFHLLSNAVKVSEEGRIILRVRPIGAAPAGGTRIQFSVTDSGPGVSDATSKRLFQRVGADGPAPSRPLGGVGLGLTLCKGLVETMNGRMGYDSPPGEGATFWFNLDLEDAEVGPVSAPPAMPAEAAISSATRAPVTADLRILLVEDEKINRMLATELLRRDGHRVKAVDNGVDGVAAAAMGDQDVVIMDLHMPGIDGVEAIRRIRALPDPIHAAIPIIALTADVTDAAQRAAREAGADAVVAKPFKLELLRRIITDLLRERAAAAGAGMPPVDSAATNLSASSLIPSGSLVVRQWHDMGPAAVIGLIDLFRETTPPRLDALEAALTAEDAHTAAEEAHALKGAAGVLGLTPLHALYSEMEMDAQCGDIAAVKDTLPRAREVHHQTIAALEEFITTSSAQESG